MKITAIERRHDLTRPLRNEVITIAVHRWLIVTRPWLTIVTGDYVKFLCGAKNAKPSDVMTIGTAHIL
jgi:hypothetical protein